MATLTYLEVENTAMTGSEVTYTFQATAMSTLFQPIGGQVTMTHVTSGDTFTIADGQSWEVTNRNLRNHTLFFVGASGVTLQSVVSKQREN